MTTPDRDDLLWRLGLDVDSGETAESETGGELPEDALLAAYRRGELDADAERRVERALAASPAARRRLAELAGLPPAQPPEQVRRRYLEAFAARSQEPGSTERPAAAEPRRPEPGRRSEPGRRPESSRRHGRSRARRIALAAAALLAVAAGVAVHRQLAAPALPPDLAYEVSASGLAEVRGGVAAGVAVEALPDTVLRIAASPVAGAVEGVEVALYRRRGAVLERLEAGPRLRVTAERGEVRFEARAGELVGGEPGVHDLYVVAARRGELAGEVPIGDGDPLALLEREGRSLAYRLSVVLRSASPTSPDPVEDPP